MNHKVAQWVLGRHRFLSLGYTPVLEGTELDRESVNPAKGNLHFVHPVKQQYTFYMP